jgi:DNA primase catalytic core
MKRAVHILPLAALSGFNPRKISQGEYVVKCPNPNHEDKTPSCHINHHKNVFHCKGCGQGGTVIDWLMLTENLNEAGAINRLKEEFSRVDFVKRQIEIEEKQPVPVNIYDPVNQKALSYYIDFCHKRFMSKTEGAGYLMKRGLIYGEIVEEFKIGFCDGSLNPGLINLKESEIYQALFDLEILKNEDGSTGSPTSNGSTREHFSNRVIFPVFDENGLIVQIYGRNISGSGAKHMLLTGVPLSLFNPRALISPEIILCESIIDALSIMAMGYRNVVSVLSVNGLKDDLFEKIISSNVKKVFIAFDNDQAGNNAALSLAEKLIDHKIESYRITFEENSDANDLLKRSENVETALDKFKEILENAPALQELLNAVQSEGYHTNTLEKKGKEYLYTIGQRFYTIRGLDQNKTDSALKIFLRLDYEEPSKKEKRFHIDNNLDLFNAKTTGTFSKAAASKLTLDERVIASDLDSLTVKLDELLKKTIEEKESDKRTQDKKKFHKNIKTSFEANAFLDEPLFILRFVNDVETCGFVGEPLNSFFGFTATLTRRLKHQLNLIIQSESSAGKSTLLNLLHDFVPEEERIYSTQITPRSLYYDIEQSLMNMSYFIAEGMGLKEAEYAIMQMISEGRLAIDYTKNDPKTGENKRSTMEVSGPVQFNLTEPEEGLNEQLENRCVIITLNMTKEQTERILDYQRKLASPDGIKLLEERERLCDFYRHVQREVKTLPVLNYLTPYLEFSSESHQARRDHKKYLTLCEIITLIFQKQREKIYKDGKLCVKTHLIDLALCHFIFRRIFGRSLDDLPIQTRNFMDKLIKYFLEVSKSKEIPFDQIWFSRKEMTEITRLSMNRTHVHINKLLFNEYVICRRDQNGFSYRFNFNVDAVGNIETIRLARMADLLKKVSRKEREEYEVFKPNLEKIFKALDPEYKGGEA